MIKTRNPFFLIGLDGGTWDVLLPMVKKGYMPNLSNLLQKGISGTLFSTIPPFTFPAWASLITGCQSGHHGILSFFQIDPKAYEANESTALIDSRSIHGRKLWEYLSEKGLKMGIINVPMTYPVHEAKEFMIAGLLTPPGEDNFFYPPSLKSELIDYIIDLGYIAGDNWLGFKMYSKKQVELIEEIINLLKIRIDTTIKLLNKYNNLDFFMIFFTSLDRICHIFWNYLMDFNEDKKSLLLSNTDRVLKEKIKEYFLLLDEAIGRIIELADEKTNFVFVSDHGFGPAPVKEFYLNNWLEERGWLALQPTIKNIKNPRYWLAKTGINKWKLRDSLNRILPRKLIYHLENKLKSEEKSLVDWSKTKAFVYPIYNYVCGISINVKGIKPQGVVEQGKEYTHIRDNIMNDIKGVIDPTSGNTIVREIFKREEIYSGSFVDHFPDLIVIMDKQYTCSKQLSNTIVRPISSSPRKGDHNREGVFLAYGPSFCKGSLKEPTYLVDLLPTILYFFDIAIPSDIDGSVINAIFKKSFLDSHSVKTEDYNKDRLFATQKKQSGQNEKNSEEIKKILKTLGYID